MKDKFAFPRNEDMFLFLNNYPKEKKTATSDPVDAEDQLIDPDPIR
jgi:hypothetical protein